MKKLLTIVLVVVMLMTMVVGCQPTETDTGTESENNGPPAKEPETEPQEFTYVFNDEPPGFDPTFHSGTVASSILDLIFEGLVTLDENNNAVPAVAEDWSISDDGLVYTFNLRDDAVWSDGERVTASDFAYAWTKIMDKETASPISYLLLPYIKNGKKYFEGEVTKEELGIKVINEKTLELTLERPTSYIMQLLGQSAYLPVRQDKVESDPQSWFVNSDTCIGNGPYKMDEYKIGESMSFVINDKYWNNAMSKLSKITFNFILDKSTALAAFEAGEVDGIHSVPGGEASKLFASDDRLKVTGALVVYFLHVNNTVEPLNNVDVRTALSLALDRQAIHDATGAFTKVPAPGTVPYGIQVNGKEFRDVAGNHGISNDAEIETAKELLAKAGYPDGEGFPEIEFTCQNNPDTIKSAEIYQQMWKKNLNINVKIVPTDSKVYWPTIVAKDYQIAFGGWGGDYVHPMTFLEFLTSDSSQNCTGWINTNYDNYVADAQKELDAEKALALMIKAEGELIGDMAIIPTSFKSHVSMMQDYVKGWRISNTSQLCLREAYIEK